MISKKHTPFIIFIHSPKYKLIRNHRFPAEEASHRPNSNTRCSKNYLSWFINTPQWQCTTSNCLQKHTLVHKVHPPLDSIIVDFSDDINQMCFWRDFSNLMTILGSLPKCGERETIASFRHLVLLLLLLCVSGVFYFFFYYCVSALW